MTMHLAKVIAQAQGWIGFDVFMAEALYAPGIGYYANDLPKFGAMPTSLGDAAVTSDRCIAKACLVQERVPWPSSCSLRWTPWV